jgi:hypothetical protein
MAMPLLNTPREGEQAAQLLHRKFTVLHAEQREAKRFCKIKHVEDSRHLVKIIPKLPERFAAPLFEQE